jgi:hypothetical protein
LVDAGASTVDDRPPITLGATPEFDRSGLAAYYPWPSSPTRRYCAGQDRRVWVSDLLCRQFAFSRTRRHAVEQSVGWYPKPPCTRSRLSRRFCTDVPFHTRRHWSVDDNHKWSSSAGVSTPRFHRPSTSFGRSPATLTVDGSPHCLLRPRSQAAKAGDAVEWILGSLRDRSQAGTRFSAQGPTNPVLSHTEAWFRSRPSETVGRLPRGPRQDEAIAQDTQREVEAPSMRFVSFRRKQPR